jgi:hypothetical protein
MHAARPDDVAAVRLRAAAPVAALLFPVIALLLAAGNELLPCDPLSCDELEERSLVLVALAAPVFPLAAALPLPLFVAVVVGVGTGFPLWGLVGRRVAGHTIGTGPPQWRRFWGRYGAVVAAWVVLVLVVARSG